MIRKIIISLFCVIFLSGCGLSQSVEDYSQSTPALDFKTFFTGPMTAHGIVQNRFTGEITRKFTADLTGTWEGNDGVLDEVFRFEDGEVWERQWNIQNADGSSFTATAEDVNGQAVGQTAGAVAHWQYNMQVPVGDTIRDMDMDDWMYLVDEDTIINRTDMKKFGITVARMTIVIRKENVE